MLEILKLILNSLAFCMINYLTIETLDPVILKQISHCMYIQLYKINIFVKLVATNFNILVILRPSHHDAYDEFFEQVLHKGYNYRIPRHIGLG